MRAVRSSLRARTSIASLPALSHPGEPSRVQARRIEVWKAQLVTWALAVVGVSLLVYAAVSRRLDGTPVTAPVVFVGIGLLLGPEVLDKLDAPSNGHSVKLLAEATLTLVLFADASRIDLTALKREYAVPVRLLGIGLPLTIVAGAVVAVGLFSGLTFLEALVLGILLAPTDAALGQAVVTLPSLPSRIRQGLNVE